MGTQLQEGGGRGLLEAASRLALMLTWALHQVYAEVKSWTLERAASQTASNAERFYSSGLKSESAAGAYEAVPQGPRSEQ